MDSVVVFAAMVGYSHSHTVCALFVPQALHISFFMSEIQLG